ncbi:hypothetical protein ACJ73_03858 [Blastomyces percursus]|uniref:Uncharacterized protein n=1 Tax=Blastomyces percursus TaxID=1658174 RepID=A0A1J9R8F2_9EURO|nr:hypothetical protein ACJ73_03858 [Blastomyces percursus]
MDAIPMEFISQRFARTCKLQRLEITPRLTSGYTGMEEEMMKEAVQVKDVGGDVSEKAFLYVAKQLNDCDVIIGPRIGRVSSLMFHEMCYAAYSRWVTKHKKGKAQVLKADIQRALEVKKVDPRTEQYHEFLDVFDRKEADKLPPFRGKRVDHEIKLLKKDGKEQEPPWGPLYNMSREELLVLRKT